MAASASLSFQSTKIVPELITVAPPCFLSIKYNENSVKIGQELTPTEVKNAPIVTRNLKELGYYTLCMADLDGCLPDVATPVHVIHWLVTNIPGNDLKKGETLAEYIGSAPRKDSGLHRYVFLLYEQPGKLKFDEKRIEKYTVDGRLFFSVGNFAEKYGFGAPAAGNMYRAQYDDYVSLLREQFK